MLPLRSVDWSGDRRALRILDQRALPEREHYLELRTVGETVDAISTLALRGAPAIGIGAAIGLVVALRTASNDNARDARALLPAYAARLVAARPTAVNLPWAIARLTRCAAGLDDAQLLAGLEREADGLLRDDRAMCDAIGMHGAALLHDGARVLTHCNAGALATSGIGTALAPVYVAHAAGRNVQVFADETRPLRQGARLTAWELARAGIPVTVLPDGAAASLIASGRIDLVLVGADRIAANGDVANKVGTYGVALAAKAHGIPLYVAAPWSTIDPHTACGGEVVIEHRGDDELAPLPAGVGVFNPAFDITPSSLIAGFITNRGIVAPPFTDLH